MFDPKNIIDCNDPEKLFKSDLDKTKGIYHELAKKFHPDVYKGEYADILFQHITELYHKAIYLIENNYWNRESILRLTKIDSGIYGNCGTYIFTYNICRPFEYGYYYVSKKSQCVIYVYERAINDTNKPKVSWKFANDKMKQEFHRYLPSITETFYTDKNYYVVIISKPKGYINLRDVYEYRGNKFDAKSIAWIMSSLHNLCCYFSYADITHNNITIDNYYVHPEKHDGMLLGGWEWYVKRGDPISKVPKFVYNILPWKVKINKIASSLTDLECIRAIGRQLMQREFTPKSMIDHFESIANVSAFEDYKRWQQVIIDSFGERKYFIENYQEDNIYI
jgi:hypothetical protein